jgi:hypothetical protein
MFFFHRETDNSGELPRITERIADNGGSVVAYRQTYSFVFFTISRIVYEYLPRGRSASIVGMKHAVLSLLFGPWSWLGPFLTLQSLTHNLSGGIDITHATGFRPDGVFLPLESLESDAEQKEKALQYGYVTILFAVLAILIWKLVIPQFDPTVWSSGFLVQLLVIGILVIITKIVVSKFRK